ncbi:hypothetical protein AANUM_1629 [Aggregatibacter actinomycetemcomitans NUM4039]|nr:hypothetical protein AANUM_1629 [Aggregatibacter actinomycetemcomitans NUM4039]
MFLSIKKAQLSKPSFPIKNPNSNSTLSLGCNLSVPLTITLSSQVPINIPKSEDKDEFNKSVRKL